MTEKPQSILIVEDDRQAARDLQQALGRLGYDAYAVATSAEEAVSHASKRRPDLVLVDVGIKGQIDGIDAAVILHGRYGVPIVYLAEPTDESTIERATSTGFFMYLLKPVRPGELRTVIALALRNPEAAKAPLAVGTAQVRPRVEGAGPVARGKDRSTVLLADDHAVLREGLAKLLTEHHFEVVGTVADGDQLLDAAKRLRPDVIVTDISMPPGLSGLDVLDQLKAQRSVSRVIVLTMHNDPVLATRAARAGAAGFLLKHSAGEELVTAIHEALQGRVYFTSAVTKGVMERLSAPAGPSEPVLTSRQLDVLRLILEGRRMKEIAAALDLSSRTVETHKYQMMETLGVSSTAELVKYAIAHRLIEG